MQKYRARILFVGDLNKSGRSYQRYSALSLLASSVKGISMFPLERGRSSFFVRLFSKLGIPLDETNANERMREELRGDAFDIIWVEKGNTIRPATLRSVKQRLPKATLVSISEDDMYAQHNHSFYYRCGLKYYDMVFTTKVYNLEELKRFGARRTELFLDAYDEELHRPVVLNEEEKRKYGADVGFIGTFEKDRAEKMLFLAENGVRVVVWGNGWSGWRDKSPNLVIKNKAIYGEEYVKAINATKINLCFLRKMNRDEVTSRSVEIPACGAFMLGERTKRHEEFFEEGKEAEFFGSEEELLRKTTFYLSHDEERKRIAEAGRERCARSGYSHTAQLAEMLRKIDSI